MPTAEEKGSKGTQSNRRSSDFISILQYTYDIKLKEQSVRVCDLLNVKYLQFVG